MSLRIWLPLTKDLRNQGLDDVTITNNGATFNSAGKLGGCYKTSNSGDIDLKYSGAQINTGSLSLCGWFKFNKAELAATWGSYSFDSTRPNPTGNLIGNNSYGGVGLIWSTNSLASGAAFTSLYVACSIRSTTNGARITSNIIIPFDTWVHLALVFNKDTKALELWLNGELKVTNAMLDFNDAKTDNLKLNYRATWGGNNPSYNIPFLVNDIRIYDHALSPLEVKEISKGLILHYPLNREGWGQVNLVNNSNFSNLATTGTVIRDETVLFHGYPTCKISRTGATSNTYTGWSSQDLFSRLTPGTKVTASVWVYRENTHGIDSGCEWRMYQRYNNGASTDWAGFYSASDWPIGEWKRFTRTYTIRSDVSGAFLNFNVVRNGTYWLAEPKVEIGEKATSWSPSVTDTLTTIMDLNSTIEYDCSGYCNNGTRTGIFSWTSDTPKYEVSTNFSTISQHIHLNYDTNGFKDSYSIGFWLKYNSTQTNSAPEIFGIPAYACLYISGNLIYWNTNDGTNNPFKNNGSTLSITPYVNNWHHFVITGNGTNVILYIDGVEAGRATTYKHFGGNKIVLSDKDNTRNTYSFIGLVSDFRIYTTALSADDVKSLYNNSAYIDNQGNIYGAVYEEV